MEINRHFCFRTEYSSIIQKLDQNEVKYDICDGMVVVDILESNSAWPFIEECLGQYSIPTLKETFFDEEEMRTAEWLSVRSKWHNGYPQPEAGKRYMDITYSKEAFCSQCGVGLVQNAPFCIKSSPKWGKRCFMSLNWVQDELFVNDKVRNLFQTENYSGIRFIDVLNKGGTGTLPDIYQMRIDNYLDAALVSCTPSIDAEYECLSCHQKKYHPTGRGKLIFCREAFQGMPDIVKTAEYFGWGCGANRRIIVSQKVYRFVMEKALGRSLVFEPIELS